MSADITWAIVRNNSAYLLKKRGCPKPFNTDPLNLTNKNSQRYVGMANTKAVGIQPLPKSVADSKEKGFVLTVKKGRANRPVSSTATVTMKSGARASLPKIRSMLGKQRYRKDLTKAALRRASAIIRSQKPLPKRKGTKAAKKAE
jgi:large subunit ribosomal protein L28e